MIQPFIVIIIVLLQIMNLNTFDLTIVWHTASWLRKKMNLFPYSIYRKMRSKILLPFIGVWHAFTIRRSTCLYQCSWFSCTFMYMYNMYSSINERTGEQKVYLLLLVWGNYTTACSGKPTLCKRYNNIICICTCTCRCLALRARLKRYFVPWELVSDNIPSYVNTSGYWCATIVCKHVRTCTCRCS